jgi:hypothetical protein
MFKALTGSTAKLKDFRRIRPESLLSTDPKA